MSKIIFKTAGGGDVTIFAADGDNVLSLAREAGAAIDAPCSGNAVCGKCRVKLLSGSVDYEPSRHLPGEDAARGWRLACVSTVSGDAVFSVPDFAGLPGGQMLPGSRLPDYELLVSGLAAAGIKPDYMANAADTVMGCTAALPGFGIAIDLGTTTVSGLLVDMQTGIVLAAETAINDQVRYGADVIHRIIEQQKPGGIEKLQHSIVKRTLLPMIGRLRAGAGIGQNRISRMTIASNTTMNHLLLGVDAGCIRTEPYIPAFLEKEPFNPSQTGIDLVPDALAYIAPNAGSYVGGDITAGVLASMIWDDEELSVLIDLGTNGEIVFGNNEFLMTCACSAGPAFEGGDISCGMRAVPGAVEGCVIDAATMEPELTVIGGGKPLGLCGSGLIDTAAGLFRAGIINGKGRFIREGERIRRDEYGIGSYILAFAGDSATGSDIAVNEVDLDNFIRAKGAVFSALISLLQPLGFTTGDIGRVLVAGGIGSGININNAISTGMLPALPPERYSYIGNSSLAGAYAMLISEDAREKVREIARNMTYIELSTEPGYMDSFIAACFLPHTDTTLFEVL